MDIVQAFTENNEINNITIKIAEDGEPIFQANEIAKILEIKNIHATLKLFDTDEKVLINNETPGGNQIMTFLTELGLYRLLNISRKPIARTFQKWVAGVIKQIRKTGQYKLENSLKETVEKNERDYELKLHNNLIQMWKKKNGVYIGKIKNIDDKIIIKIGSTKDIEERAIKLKHEFKTEILIMNFFEINRHMDFEKALHRDSNIRPYQYTEEINGHVSCETFCIPKNYYNDLIMIIKRKQKDYEGETNEQLFELKKLNAEIELQKLLLLREQEKNKTPVVVYKEVPCTFVPDDNKKIGKGFKIQKYTMDGQLVCTYNGITMAERKEPRMSSRGLRGAIKNNYEYNNHRWMFLDRNLPDDTVQTLPELQEHKINPTDFVAMLDFNKENIVKVFEDQLAACAHMQLKSTLCIYKSIRQGALCRGHHFMYFTEVPEELRNKYLEYNTLPEVKRRYNSISVKQINPINNEVIKEYQSYTDIVREFQMSLCKIKKIIASGEVYKGYIWSR